MYEQALDQKRRYRALRDDGKMGYVLADITN
jgi:hypothetical protein